MRIILGHGFSFVHRPGSHFSLFFFLENQLLGERYIESSFNRETSRGKEWLVAPLFFYRLSTDSTIAPDKNQRFSSTNVSSSWLLDARKDTIEKKKASIYFLVCKGLFDR